MRRGAFGILMLAVIRPHSTIFQFTVIYGIVISIRSEQYTDAIGIPATALYSVGVRITVDMQSAQYRSVNSAGIAETGPTTCVTVRQRIEKFTVPAPGIFWDTAGRANVCRPIAQLYLCICWVVKICFIIYVWRMIFSSLF